MQDSIDFCCQESDEEEGRPEYIGVIQPYMFEPIMSDTKAAAVETEQQQAQSYCDSGRHLADVSTWCTCRHCTVMSADEECHCCNEIKQALQIHGVPQFRALVLGICRQTCSCHDSRMRCQRYSCPVSIRHIQRISPCHH